MMKQTLWNCVFSIVLFVGLNTVCKSPKPLNENTKEATLPITESPKIIFLNCSIKNDSLKEGCKIQIIDKVLTEGKVKENDVSLTKPEIDDLVYFVLNKDSNVLKSGYLENPLNRTVEYVADNNQFNKKKIQKDSTSFFLRISLDATAKYISIQRYKGLEIKNVPLLFIDVFKNEP